MKKAVFLDRDGVLLLNHQHYYIWKQDQMEFVEGVFENLRSLQQKGYILLIVSNQGGISRGLYTKDDILRLHEHLVGILSHHQIHITDILFCPHHPDIEKCLCRKPASLMIDKLIAKYEINVHESVMIGDNESDMSAAEQAGIGTIRISSNENMLHSISQLLR